MYSNQFLVSLIIIIILFYYYIIIIIIFIIVKHAVGFDMTKKKKQMKSLVLRAFCLLTFTYWIDVPIIF